MLINTNEQRPPFVSTTDKIIEQLVEWDTLDIIRARYAGWKLRTWSIEKEVEREIYKSHQDHGLPMWVFYEQV